MSREILVKQKTSIVWCTAGESPDHILTLDSLANNAGRAGDECDLTATFAARYAVFALIHTDIAPVAGNVVELYWASSPDGSQWPGGVHGYDEVYKAGEEDEWKKQLLLVGCLVVTADTSSQKQMFVFSPPTRYGVPVVINKTGQAFSGSDPQGSITLVPLADEVQ